MSTEEQTTVVATNEAEVTKPIETPNVDPKDVEVIKASEITAEANSTVDKVEDGVVDQDRVMKELDAKELYCNGSRNFLVKNYSEAADQLSQVCAIYEDLYGELSDELGMPYLLYAKSLIALALDENKVIDVPDEEELEDDDDDDDDDEDDAGYVEGENAPTNSSSNGSAAVNTCSNGSATNVKLDAIKEKSATEGDEKEVSKTSDETVAESTTKTAEEKNETVAVTSSTVLDDEKPSTSNGDAVAGEDGEEEENDAASNLQLAWEILELADKIFLRQGSKGVSNLAEVRTELANIEFENNLPEAARDDYVKALKIYIELPSKYRRAMAEIHYKIGLTYLMQQLNKEGAESLKEACKLIDDEIKELEASEEELSEKQKSKIQDMEETKQEIWAKIAEIEDTQAQNIAEVRAALDSYIKPIRSTEENNDAAGSSVSSAAGVSSSSSAKPTDISHLIKRKKPADNGADAEVSASPAKRPAL